LFFCSIFFFFQKEIIFFPSKNIVNIPSNINIEEVFLKTEDNIRLHSWYLDNNSEKTVLFFHGNAGNLSDRKKQIEVFNDLNLNALILDYRGYGKSEGSIKKENDLYVDAKTALEFLLEEKKIATSDIIIWGRSLGGAVAIDIAQNINFSAVIIESSFFSMDYLINSKFWILPVRFLSRFHFRSDKKIKKIRSKTLIVHSLNDKTIPFVNGQKLFRNRRGRACRSYDKDFLEIHGSHNYGFIESYDLYIKTIAKFLGE